MSDLIAPATPEAKRPSPSPRKRMAIFRAADAEVLGAETMAMSGFDDTARAAFAQTHAAGATTPPEKNLVLFSEPGGEGMSLVYAWFKSGFILPRHSHNADCLYYVVGGELKMGTQVLRKGDGVFIPANNGYTYEVGPEGVEVLEFRNAGRFDFVVNNMGAAQWGRYAEAVIRNEPNWAAETVPPSER